jgi:hypothetical protein
MRPFVKRKLRAMSGTLVVVLSLAVAGLVALSVRRIELGREPGPTACSRVVDDVYQRSAQPFALRDATGEAVIEPAGMTVRTRHSTTKFSGGAGLSSRGRASERLLKENDVAYVLGELSIARDQNGATVRRVAVAENGRRLLVSNLSQSQLLVIERVWLWVGTAVFLTAAIVLPWAYYQRYHVRVAPARVAAESGAER